MKNRIEIRSMQASGSRASSQSNRFVYRSFVFLLALLCASLAGPVFAGQQSPLSPATAIQAQKLENLQDIVAKQAALVSEFDVNGLKVLVKRREGSLTVAAGLFIRGGTRNITADNAGIEALMLSAATEASANFPRERMRTDLSRMGTVLNSAVNYDYSSLSLITTRPNFD